MRVYIERDEFWPWLLVTTDKRRWSGLGCRERDVPGPVYNEYVLAQEAYLKAHAELLDYYEGAK